MSEKDFFILGSILKTSGHSGKLILLLDVDSVEKYTGLKEIYFKTDKGIIPFLISAYELNKNKTATILLSGYTTVESVEQFLKKEVYLPLRFLPQLNGNNFYFHEITGFDVIDSVCGNIGKVNSVIEMPHQNLLQVFQNRTEILVPILKNTFRKVNRLNKTLEIETPEGLIDVYLNPNKNEKED